MGKDPPHVSRLVLGLVSVYEFFKKSPKTSTGKDSAASGLEGLEILSEKLVETVIVDFKMPEMDGLEFLERAHAKYPDIPVIMVTAYGTIEMAVKAMKKGAFSYLTKPMNYEEMLLLIRQAVEKKQLVRNVQELQQEVRKRN